MKAVQSLPTALNLKEVEKTVALDIKGVGKISWFTCCIDQANAIP